MDIQPEHLFLGLLKDEESIPASILSTRQIRLAGVRGRLPRWENGVERGTEGRIRSGSAANDRLSATTDGLPPGIPMNANNALAFISLN